MGKPKTGLHRCRSPPFSDDYFHFEKSETEELEWVLIIAEKR